MNITSPCVRNCCLDQEDVCMGCGRTLDEITRWSDAEDAERTEILGRARKRMDSMRKRWPSDDAAETDS